MEIFPQEVFFKKKLKEKKLSKMNKQLGINTIWNGPLDTSMFPTEKGDSNGINGIQLLAKNQPACKRGPITERAKGY